MNVSPDLSSRTVLNSIFDSELQETCVLLTRTQIGYVLQMGLFGIFGGDIPDDRTTLFLQLQRWYIQQYLATQNPESSQDEVS